MHTAPLILCAHVIPRTRARHVPAPQLRVGNTCVRPCLPFGTVRARPTSPHSHVGACIDSVCLHRDLDHTSAFALKHFTLSTEGFRVCASGPYPTCRFATRRGIARRVRFLACFLLAAHCCEHESDAFAPCFPCTGTSAATPEQQQPAATAAAAVSGGSSCQKQQAAAEAAAKKAAAALVAERRVATAGGGFR